MHTWEIVLLIVIICAVGLLITGEVFCLMSMSRNFKKGTIYKTRNRIYDSQDTEWFEAHKKETSITGSCGFKEVGYVFAHEEETDAWMIVVHGYSSQALNMANYIKGFYHLGYNVLAPELMGMGKSEGDFVAMAGYDARDVRIWIDRLLEKHPAARIGLMGASMGAATVMNTLDKSLPGNVEFVIEDSGYTNLTRQVKYQLRTIYHMNFWSVFKVSSLMTKLHYGFFIGDVNAEPALKTNRLPLLALHGDADDFVPPEFARVAYNLSQGPKEIRFFKGARHIRAEHQQREAYWDAVTAFLKRYSSLYRTREE